MITDAKNRMGFSRGIRNLKYQFVKEVRDKIKVRLGIVHRSVLYQKEVGASPISPAEADEIESILKEYGVSENEVWNE